MGKDNARKETNYRNIQKYRKLGRKKIKSKTRKIEPNAFSLYIFIYIQQDGNTHRKYTT